MWMNVQLTMSATRTPSVQTQTVATRAAVLMATREMERYVQVSCWVPLLLFDNNVCGICMVFVATFTDVS